MPKLPRTLVLVSFLAILLFPSPILAQIPVLWPMVFSGQVTVGNEPVSEGRDIVARIGSFESRPATTLEGRYVSLSVGPQGRNLLGQPISFHMDGLTAAETALFVEVDGPVTVALDLSFPAPTPTPTPTAEPTETPEPTLVPTATPVPQHTATPGPTATAALPVPGDANVDTLAMALGALGVTLLFAGAVLRRTPR